jgi:hypothetical protein
MIMQLKKAPDGKGTLTYIRADGTRTWMQVSPYFAQHDLLHYAVESVLGYREAFMGLIASGKSLSDFEDGAKHWLPTEAHWAEIIVGAIQSQMAGAATPDQFDWSVSAACEGLGLPVPTAVTGMHVETICSVHSRLLAAWYRLPVNEVLELSWPPAEAPGQSASAVSPTIHSARSRDPSAPA